MNKKTNTLLFILGATLFNIIVTVALFLLLFLIYVRFFLHLLPQEWGFPLLFIAAIILSFFVYRFALKLLLKKVPVEKYFDPIFGKRK